MAEYVVDRENVCPYGSQREEIVRCRDCRHFVKDATPYDVGFEDFCTQHGSDFVREDGFCAWGERRPDHGRR